MATLVTRSMIMICMYTSLPYPNYSMHPMHACMHDLPRLSYMRASPIA